MPSRAFCPCCASLLLRHVRASGLYWFCPHCYQEMPNFLTVEPWLRRAPAAIAATVDIRHSPVPRAWLSASA